jgi:diacylglycerol kinase family enzyme
VARDGTTLLVANPTARSGRARRSVERALELLAAAGLRPEFLPTLPRGGTVAIIAQRIERGGVARVVYLGGDGTFAEAAKGIIFARESCGADVPLGMLPMGTANDQGRSFGIPAGERALPGNVAIIAAGVEQFLDVGTVEAFGGGDEPLARDLWFDSFGVGLSALVLAARNRDRAAVDRWPVLRDVYRDKLVYVGAAVRAFLGGLVRPTRFAVELEVDGAQTRHEAVNEVLVKGTLLYAGDWIFDPDAKPDDGRFEVVVIHGAADWAAAAIRGHKHNPTTADDLEVLGVPPRAIVRGRRIEVRLERPRGLPRVPAQIDGEEFVACDHYAVENLVHHLRIVVPEDARWI